LKAHPKGRWQANWDAKEATRDAFARTQAGKKADVEWDAFNAAANNARKTARAILRKQPKTVAGAAVIALAAVYEGEWAGFFFPIAASESALVRCLSRAGGVRLPAGVRRAMP